jgi:hypothetical protein
MLGCEVALLVGIQGFRVLVLNPYVVLERGIAGLNP